jgi:AraC-like DNA-binding protein
MDINAIVNFLLIAGVIQGFIFNLVTLLFRKRFSIVVLYLNLVVLFISLNNLQAWLIEVGYSSDLFYIKNMLVPWYFFILPMFYAFIIHFLEVDKTIIGFVKFAIVVFVAEILLRSAVIYHVYYNVPDQDIALINQYTMIEDIFNLALSIAIFYKAIELVFKRENVYQSMLSYDDLKWLKLFFKVGGLVMVFWVFAKMADFMFGIKWGYSVLRLGTSVLLYWIGYQGLYRYNIVQDRIQLRKRIATSNKFIGIGAIATSNVDDKHREEFKKVHDLVVSEKKYLEPELSMSSLAETLSISPSHLSKLVNNHSGFSFSDYINSLRVEQAKKLLADPNFNNYTMVAIGLECGFNSRSTFYAAFKKFTAATPTEYLKKSGVS